LINRQRAARAPTFQDRCVTGTRGGLRLSGAPRLTIKATFVQVVSGHPALGTL